MIKVIKTDITKDINKILDKISRDKFQTEEDYIEALEDSVFEYRDENGYTSHLDYDAIRKIVDIYLKNKEN